MTNRLEALLNLQKRDPKDSFLLYGIALEYMSAKNYEEAEKYFKTLLSQNPKYVPAYMQYARLKENLNENKDAGDLYKQGINIAKETGDYHAVKEMEEFLDELE